MAEGEIAALMNKTKYDWERAVKGADNVDGHRQSFYTIQTETTHILHAYMHRNINQQRIDEKSIFRRAHILLPC